MENSLIELSDIIDFLFEIISLNKINFALSMIALFYDNLDDLD